MRKQSREAILLIIFLFIIPGCVSMPPLPSSQFQLDQIDTAALKGKVIVIDPGHGGMYRGAIGKMGLRESEVNMGVALYLWGLLHDAGAYPIMTRTADTNAALSPSKQLRDDLLARSRLSNYLKPDLFISIHHNSNTNDTKKNTLEVYYKLMDPVPSQELAEYIMERIENTFEVEKAQVLPGNYSVLRETRATAILGEASYLTHKKNERRLSLHGFLRLEAEAYFLGILDYFRGGVPRILNLTPNGDFLCDAQPEVVGLVKDDEHGKGIDPDSVTLYLDGKVVATRYDPLTGRVRYIPESPLNNGSHTLRLEAKNLGGNSATPVSTVFYTSLYPFQIETRPLIATLLPDGLSRTRITAEIVDENLNPVADGTLVSFYTSAGRVVDSLVTSRKGKAVTHLIADYQLGHAEVVVASGGVYDSCIVTLGEPEEKIIEVYVHDRQGNPLEGAEVIFEEETYLKTDHLGYCFNKGNDDGGLEFTVWKNGYLPLKGFLDLGGEEVVREKLVLTPVDHGLMWHKVIVIDPQGREDSSLTDDSRERSRAEINYTTALCLRKMLELAGATVFLTRGSDSVSTPIERVIKANNTRADLLISLDHRKGSSYLGYYFNSSKGKFLARSIKQVIDDELSCKKLKMMGGREFVLVHTGMPTVVVSLDCRRCKRLPRDEEERPWVEAQALYQGLRSYFKGISQF